MSEADWDRLRNMTDEEVHRRALADPDAQPTTAADWKNARVVMPATKQATSIRLDPDVIDWFKREGRGYQTRINAVLRSYMEAKGKGGKRARA
ncbi:MAG: BrnA antitoxin family protein [Micropepsaceae bacterium]